MEEDQSLINAQPVSVCSANTSLLYNARISNNLSFRFQIKKIKKINPGLAKGDLKISKNDW